MTIPIRLKAHCLNCNNYTELLNAGVTVQATNGDFIRVKHPIIKVPEGWAIYQGKLYCSNHKPEEAEALE